MIEILFVACLVAPSGDDARCHEHSLRLPDVTLTACLLVAQPQLARWADEHPGERISRWRCRQVPFGEQEI